MRHPRVGWLIGLAAVAVAAGSACQQTVHLYAAPDSGSTGGNGGIAGFGGFGGKGGKSGSTGYGGTYGFDGGAPDGRCFGPPLAFTPDTPQMVVALDRSTSMNQPFGPDSQTQLNAAIPDVGGEYYEYGMPHTQRPQIGFSYISFPDYMTSGCGAPQSGCCSSDATKDWSGFWMGVTNCANPSTNCVTSPNRPIAATLQKATAVLTGTNAARPFQRYVVLLTDGSPKTECTQNDCATAQAQVSTMVGQGIKLRVVGIGDQSEAAIGTCPKNLVTAAGDLGHYYAAPTDRDLQTVLDQAMADAVCAGTLNPAPSSGNNLQVFLNGPVYPGGQDGWTYDDMGHLHFHGSSCSAYAASRSQDLYITNGCDAVHGGPGSSQP